jgi:sulfhydrogenase subunit beta (sulfur reductase)
MEVTTKDDLTAWLDDLAERLTLIAPTAVQEQIFYRPVATSSEIVFDFGKADLPVKEYFLPSTHVLLSIERGEDGIRLEEPALDGQRVAFGLRPCDARALRVMDALFLDQEPADPYYAERREKTTLVGLACREMGDECFCTSLGLSPDDASDVDLMLTEIGEGGDGRKGGEGGARYAVQVVTEKGAKLLGSLSLVEVEGACPELVEGAVPMPTAGDKTPILEAEAWPEHFDQAYWARVADRCLSCRVCTYVCPTCRCFDVRDYGTLDGASPEVGVERLNCVELAEGARPERLNRVELVEGGVERLRAWDSCMSEGYRRIAGGHNPRPTKADRLRNRFYCKFCYYPRDFGPVACVGCGRCISNCPVNVDIVEVLEGVAALSAGRNLSAV